MNILKVLAKWWTLMTSPILLTGETTEGRVNMPEENKQLSEELQAKGRVYDRLLLKKDVQSFWLFRDPHGARGAFGEFKWLCFLNTDIPYNYIYCNSEQEIEKAAQELSSMAWHAHVDVHDPSYFGRGLGRWPSEAYINAMKDALDRSSKAESADSAPSLFSCGE